MQTVSLSLQIVGLVLEIVGVFLMANTYFVAKGLLGQVRVLLSALVRGEMAAGAAALAGTARRGKAEGLMAVQGLVFIGAGFLAQLGGVALAVVALWSSGP